MRARLGIFIHILVYWTPNSHVNSLPYYLHIESNALRALQGLGLLEAILAKINQVAPGRHQFAFMSGTGDHEFVYDVSIMNATN